MKERSVDPDLLRTYSSFKEDLISEANSKVYNLIDNAKQGPQPIGSCVAIVPQSLASHRTAANRGSFHRRGVVPLIRTTRAEKFAFRREGSSAEGASV